MFYDVWLNSYAYAYGIEYIKRSFESSLEINDSSLRNLIGYIFKSAHLTQMSLLSWVQTITISMRYEDYTRSFWT